MISVDDFIIPRELRKRGSIPHIDYFENTFDHDAFRTDIDRQADTSDSNLVIAEGVFLFKRELAEMWNLKIWLEMSTSESTERGAIRDADLFGGSDKARAEYELRFVPAHTYHLERDRPQEAADIVFNVSAS